MGELLGLGFALAVGANSIITRRGVLRASVNYVANISILCGPVFFLLLCLATGEILRLAQFTWKAYVFFAISGVIHFVLGRTFGYRSIQILGSTRSNVFTGLQAVVSIILAVVVLKETLTPLTTLGILLTLSGPLLIAWKEQNAFGGRQSEAKSGASLLDKRTLFRGMFFGAGSALFWGSSAIFVKLGLENGGSSIAGSLTAYVAASLVIMPLVMRQESRREIATADNKCLQLALMTGITTIIGQLCRFLALGYGSVVTVSVVSRTTPIWVLLLGFVFNRRLESFGPWVLLGNTLLLVGTVMVIL